MTRVVVIVPALNEAPSIEAVVREASPLASAVIVIDDGSTDGTAAVAEEAGAIVVRHEHNRGVGAAIASGLRAAREMHADVVVQVDGDGQHDVSYVPTLVRRIDDGADLVVGTRFENGFEMGTARRLVLRCFAWAINQRIGVQITDPTSGFRAFSGRAADALAPIFPTKYLSDTVEVLYLAHECELAIATIPVRMTPRTSGASSVGLVTGIVYTMRVIAIVASHSARSRSRG